MATGSSCEPKEGSLSFFKVIRYPSSPHLSLPKVFVERYLDKIPRNPILKTETGEHSWKLKIIKIGENYCFSHGWDKLVKDAQLCIRDMVVFWLIDPFTFQVSFLNEDGCEKDLPIVNTNDDDNGDNDVGGDDGENVRNDDDDDDDDKVMLDDYPAFKKLISEKTHKYTLLLPKKFVKAAGLENKTSIMIKDLEGHEWLIGIIIERYENSRHSLSLGWSLFREHHQLSDGDICLFKFNKKEGVLYLTQVIKSRRPSKNEISTERVKKKRGRQSLHLGGGDVKIEDECSPIEKCGGGVKVETEYESSPEVEVAKRKRGRPPLNRPCDDGGGVKVNIEDETFPEVVVAKRKKGRPPLEKPGDVGGSVEVKVEPGTERLVRNMRVVYF